MIPPMASNKRQQVMAPLVNLLSLADSEVHVVCHFLNVSDHSHLGQTCRQLRHSCSQPAAWQYFVDERSVNVNAPPASFWVHVGCSVRMLDVSRRKFYLRNFVNAVALTNTPSLQVLDLTCHHMTHAMTRALANISSLQTLLINCTTFADVSALVGLKHLKTLELSSTLITDASALAGLTALQTLDLYGTNIANVSALANLTALQILYLRNTRSL